MQPIIHYLFDAQGRVIAAVVSGLVGNATPRDNQALRNTASQ